MSETPTGREPSPLSRGDSPSPYWSLFDALTDAIFILDEGGVVIECSELAWRQLGYERDELVGKHLGDLDAPDYRARGAERFRELMGGTPAVFQTEHVRKDGTVMPVEVSARRIDYQGTTVVLGSCRDITRRRDTERAMTETEALYRSIVESSPLGMHFYGLRADGRLVFEGANPAADRILGLEHSKLAGRTIEEAWPQLAETSVPDAYRAVARDGAPRANEETSSDESGRVTASFDVHAFQTTPGHMVAVFEEITRRKQTEHELAEYRENLERIVEERTAALSEANEQLEGATRAKDAFLASMSHELRTPLNSIIGFSSVMLQGMAGPLTDEQRRQVEMIERSGRILLGLVGDVLDLARIESGRVDVDLAEFEIERLIDTMVRTMEPLAAEKGLALSCDTSGSPKLMTSDRGKVEQVLLNLLSNAVKYTESGRIDVRVTDNGDGTVSFAVEDTGIGIPAEDLDTIFEEFRQLVPSSRREAKHPGSGLGLAISRQLAQMLGGDVAVSSTLGEGSTFTLTLPIVTPSETSS